MRFAAGGQLATIGSNSFSDTGIERIVIPKSVEVIQEYAFDGCRNLKEVVFEEGSMLKTIAKRTFTNCGSLAKITLPEGLKSIEMGALSWSKSLKSI